ncbi:hypothetical protein GUITHDRAFT_109558 [Guillardia theta CCMP2712]|uniref:FAD/NAD(P)-binding domain-containing protein n=1 Tax=Guillardia theta (strain CCMP2712) TaxID=905079 RepID=L1J7Y4_GUITC|nr:hypothetical protein GUITHDRAFT_109558 [Guillardia theta CCMP2712]EKX44437.1 hypothetical protein GUITHDRAFT_109558 [Guillardia theta CCMP2712]|eukprot:XP_005831417.1 hypothetical protein GUITHDRAFT_109558 [Guillardia theta CCMP2712]
MGELLVEVVVLLLKGFLVSVDLLLLAVQPVMQKLGDLRRSWGVRNILHLKKEEKKKKKVVVIGASFAGLEASRHLSKHAEVTIIEERSFFEYTPGVLRCFVDPQHFYSLACSLHLPPCQIVTGHVTDVQAKQVVVEFDHGGEKQVREIPFDYCLLAMGSSYNGAIRPRREEKTMSCRAMTWMHENSKLQQAPSALVVGAGLVGVELAAEIIAVYPSKRVTLVYGTQV